VAPSLTKESGNLPIYIIVQPTTKGLGTREGERERERDRKREREKERKRERERKRGESSVKNLLTG